jgi:hypothetical protein
VVQQGLPGQVLEDLLADVVGRLDIELDADDGAERAERHDMALEVRVAAADAAQLAVGGDELEAGDGGGEIAVAIARAVGGGGSSPATSP